MINNEQASSNYKLRFLDESGNSYPDWKKQKIDDIFILQSGLKNKSKDDFLINMNHHFIPFISIFKSKILKDDLRKVFIGTNENQNNVKRNDLILNITSEIKEEVGWINLFELDEENIYLNSFSKILRSKNEKLLNSYFLKYMFKSTLVRKKIIELGQGYTRVNLNLKDFMKLNVLLPSLAEQQKIGNHLSNIDYYLQLQQEEITLTKEYKKSLLTEIFSQKIRFLDENGNSYPNWKETDLENYIKISVHNNIIKDEIEVITNYENLRNVLVKTKQVSKDNLFTTRHELFLRNTNKSRITILPKNSILISKTGEGRGKICLTKFSSILDSTLYFIEPINKNLDNLFIFYFLYNQKEFLKIIGEGSTIKTINKNDIYNIDFSLPPICEQQKIGDFLSNLDQEINQLELEYKNLNEYKNILLNKLIL